MERLNKKILYNIFGINNNINAEININKPNTQKNSLKLSINKLTNNSRANKIINNRKNSRNEHNYLNQFHKGNYFYSYNNNDYQLRNNKVNSERENYIISERNNLNINEEQRHPKKFLSTFSSSQSTKRRNNLTKSYQNIFDEDDDVILTKKYNEIKKLHKLFDENIELKKQIKLLKEEIIDINNINKANLEIINNKNSQIYKLNNFSQKLKQKLNELFKIITNNENIISKLNKDKIKLEQELILAKKEISNKNDELDILNDRYRNLQIKINERNNEKILLKNKKENCCDLDKKISNNILIFTELDHNNQQINKLDSKRFLSAQKQKENINSNLKERNRPKINSILKSLDSADILENFEIKNRIPSTPSFKSKESIKDSKIEIIEKNNDMKDNNINNEDFNIKFYQNKYLYYFKLYQECKNHNEILEKEKKELTQKIVNNINKNNNNDEHNNSNNLMTTLSEIKLHCQYNPNEYFIICDKEYGELKWFLMKKRIDYESSDTYDNLFWAPKIDVVDIDKFNEYSNEDDNNNFELLNVIKKLEEKENIISKLTYKIEKLEKDIDYYKNNSDFSDIYDEIFVKTKHKNKNNKKTKNV